MEKPMQRRFAHLQSLRNLSPTLPERKKTNEVIVLHITEPVSLERSRVGYETSESSLQTELNDPWMETFQFLPQIEEERIQDMNLIIGDEMITAELDPDPLFSISDDLCEGYLNEHDNLPNGIKVNEENLLDTNKLEIPEIDFETLKNENYFAEFTNIEAVEDLQSQEATQQTALRNDNFFTEFTTITDIVENIQSQGTTQLDTLKNDNCFAEITTITEIVEDMQSQEATQQNILKNDNCFAEFTTIEEIVEDTQSEVTTQQQIPCEPQTVEVESSSTQRVFNFNLCDYVVQDNYPTPDALKSQENSFIFSGTKTTVKHNQAISRTPVVLNRPNIASRNKYSVSKVSKVIPQSIQNIKAEDSTRSENSVPSTSNVLLKRKRISSSSSEISSPSKRSRNNSVGSTASDTSFSKEQQYRIARDKNNEASRRSRQNRKLKEKENENLVATLTEKNSKLTIIAESLQTTVDKFREILKQVIISKK